MNWWHLAACRGEDPDLFFADTMDTGNSKALKRIKADYIEQAKNICRRCPVRTECRTYAYQHGEKDGIWAGLTPDERGYRCGHCGQPYIPTNNRNISYCSPECRNTVHQQQKRASKARRGAA